MHWLIELEKMKGKNLPSWNFIGKDELACIWVQKIALEMEDGTKLNGKKQGYHGISLHSTTDIFFLLP